MKWGRPAAIVALVGIISVSLAFTIQTLWFLTPSKEDRLNVLVLSLCSLRYQELKHYGHSGESVAPEIDEFIANSSFVFDNAVNGVSWVGIFAYTEGHFNNSDIYGRGYHLLSPYPDRHIYRIPNRRSKFSGNADDVDDNEFEKDHAKSTAYLGSMATTPIFSPFFVIAHHKYLHYPLIDSINKDSQWDFYLNEDDRAYLKSYLANIEKHPKKLPLALMLANETKAIAALPEVQKSGYSKDRSSLLRLAGLLTNPTVLADWQASAGYEKDLSLIRKIYAANLRYISKVLKPSFDLWGDEELKKRTVVIFTGDHGEMHMEHNQLTHATALFDTGLKVPLAIRFPGHKGKPVVIKDAVQFKMLARLIEDIIKGNVTESNLQSRLKSLQDDVLILRDCANTQRGLRFKNKYKYIVYMADGSRHLYDLESDPNELVNIAEKNPDVVDKMEGLYWENYDRFTNISTLSVRHGLKETEPRMQAFWSWISAILMTVLPNGMVTEKYTARTPTGGDLPIVMNLPKEMAGRAPALVMAPGLVYHKDLPIFEVLAERAVKAGFIVVRFNWTAFVENPKDPHRSRFFESENDDLNLAFEFARADKRVDSDRIIIVAKSMGSVLSYSLMQTKGTAVGVVLLTPLCNMLETQEPKVANSYPDLAKAKFPILFALGESDPNCLAPTLKQAIAQAGPNISLEIFSGNHYLTEGKAIDAELDAKDLANITAASDAIILWSRKVMAGVLNR